MSKIDEVEQNLKEIFTEIDETNEQRLQYCIKLEEENTRYKVVIQQLKYIINKL